MRFLSAVYTDVGIKKSTNQDSLLLLEAQTESENVICAVICDGMGGLAKGELASAVVIKELRRWFIEDFSDIYYSGMSDENLRLSLEGVIYNMNNRIGNFGRSLGINLGTTVVLLIIVAGKYYCLNIGDSRCYHVRSGMEQITKDQTFVQREIDMGRMTEQEALTHPKRSVLLQCVGASERTVPDFYTGTVQPNEVFMMCSDGFRHLITLDEFYEYLNPEVITDEDKMQEYLKYFTDLNKYRNEQDNISALLIKTL